MEHIPNLAKEGQVAGYGNDPIVIRNYVFGIPGGRTLDVDADDWPLDVIPAGTVICKNADDEYFPLEVVEDYDEKNKPYLKYNENSFAHFPEGVECAGILVASVTKDEPFASIMTQGEVNDVACPFKFTQAVKEFVRTTLDITFGHD